MSAGRVPQNNTLQRPLLSSSSSPPVVGVNDEDENVDLEQQEQPPSYDERLMEMTDSDGVAVSNGAVFHSNTAADPLVALGQQPQQRILDRDAAFFQSRGRWSVRHVSRGQARLVQRGGHDDDENEDNDETPPRRLSLTKRFWNDWFHALAYQKTGWLLLILFFLYALIIVVFAFIYLFVSLGGATTQVDPDTGSTQKQLFCDMDIHDIFESLAFSLSTMTTIGYGVSDYYFGGCMTPLVLVLMQVCCALMFDAVAIGLIFQRISRGHKRSKTVLFSHRAVVRRVAGIPHVYIRLAELRHYQLLQAKVRMYAVRHERQAQANGVANVNENAAAAGPAAVETTHFVTKPMKLVHEDVGVFDSHIMMSLPQVVVHRLDHLSPLLAPPGWLDVQGRSHEGIYPRKSRRAGGLWHSSSSSSSSCSSRQENDDDETAQEKMQRYVREMKELQSFWQDRQVEIVILLEGTDELTGASIQARHSYTWPELIWNERFAECTYTYSDYLASAEEDDNLEDNMTTSDRGRQVLRLRRARRRRAEGRRGRRNPPSCVVDFSRFHETVPAPLDTESCPYVAG